MLDTPVSPELLPPKDGEIAQKTEDLVGPYELHDFYPVLFALRMGYEPGKDLPDRRSFPLPGSMTTRQFINGFVRFAGDSFHSSLRGPVCRMVRRSERLHYLREVTGECRVMRVWH